MAARVQGFVCIFAVLPLKRAQLQLAAAFCVAGY
jgi:hypothetical protein